MQHVHSNLCYCAEGFHENKCGQTARRKLAAVRFTRSRSSVVDTFEIRAGCRQSACFVALGFALLLAEILALPGLLQCRHVSLYANITSMQTAVAGQLLLGSWAHDLRYVTVTHTSPKTLQLNKNLVGTLLSPSVHQSGNGDAECSCTTAESSRWLRSISAHMHVRGQAHEGREWERR